MESYGVNIWRMNHTIDSRLIEDLEDKAPYSDEVFAAWPPTEARAFSVKFYPWIPVDAPYGVQTPYLQVRANSGGWVELFAWCHAGSAATNIIDVAIEVLKKYPRAEQTPEWSDRVFIGHGGDRQWEVVRNYLSEAEINVIAFESDERAGLGTLSVVEQMIRASRVAVVVMTGAHSADGKLLARQNVIHEIGFAQGALGVANTIILLEDGTDEFSNIAGITQVRFSKGEIHTTRNRVLSAVTARLGSSSSL